MTDNMEKSDNELIAEFMGFIPEKSSLGNTWRHPDKMGVYGGVGMSFKYDTSWDWLMPVVEKIEKIKGVHTVISELGCDIYSFGKRVSDSREDTKLKTVYKAVVEFIKWYNSQK